MMTLPSVLFGEQSGAGSSSHGPNKNDNEILSVEQLILGLHSPQTRERALSLLSKNKEIRDDLAPILWNSFGTTYILIQEVISVYYALPSPTLLEKNASRICNALALFQCIASHPDTRAHFISAQIPAYLYPFMDLTNTEKHYEYVRVTTLGVIGALAKSNDPEAIHFLLRSEVLPCVLRCMDVGGELSKTVATFIVHKILQHDEGLTYCCALADRFFSISSVLCNMIETLAVSQAPSQRLLKYIVFCYQRLSENPRACDALRSCFPSRLMNAHNIVRVINSDQLLTLSLRKFLENVTTRAQARGQPTRELHRSAARV